MFKKLVVCAMAFSLLTSSTVMAAGGIVLAQAGDGSIGMKDGQKGFTYEQGYRDGERQADAAKAGKFGTGLVVGALTGLLGTGIGYFVVGPKSLDGSAMMKSAEKGDEYQLGFRTAWDKRTQSKKRNTFFVGGLLGTAAFVAVYLSANSSN
jgi:hypothetical protein